MDSLISVADYLKIDPSPIVEIKEDFRLELCNKIKRKYESYKSFAKLLAIPKALNMLIESCQIKKHRAHEAQDIIVDILEIPLSVTEISNKIKLSPLATYKNLRNLEKRGIVIQTRYPKNKPSIWSKTNHTQKQSPGVEPG